MPESVYFDYIEGSALEVNFDSQSEYRRSQKEDIFHLPNINDSELSRVLFFEFTDGELRPKVNRRKGYSPVTARTV